MQDQIEQIREDDQKIEEIAEKCGLEADGDEELIREAFRVMSVDNKFDESSFSVEDESPRSYSLLDHIKSSASIFSSERRYPSHGKVTDISHNKGEFTIEIKTVGHDANFSASYNFDPESDEEPPSELVSVYRVAGSTIYEPSSILGSNVPVTYGNGYVLDLPPVKPGLGKLFWYRHRRMVRNYNLGRIKNGSHSPTKKGWITIILVMGALSYASTHIGSDFLVYLLLSMLFVSCIGYLVKLLSTLASD